MPDNVTTQSGTPATLPPNIIIATDEVVGGVHVQEVKINVGGDGVDTLMGPANPVFVQVVNPSLEIANDAGNPVPVSGPLTDVQLRAAAVPVSIAAEIEVKNDAGNPLAVSGPLTDAQLRAVAVPVSGPLTDVQLRATALPVSIAAEIEVKNDAGNPLAVNLSGVTVGEKLAASSLPVVLATENSTDLLVTGPVAQSALNTLLIPQTDVSKYRFVSIQINSSASAGNYVFESSNDAGLTWVPILLQDASIAFVPVVAISATATNRIFHGAISGALFRARISNSLTGGVAQAFANFSQTIGPLALQPIISASTLVVAGNGTHNATIPSNTLLVGYESRTTARAATGDTFLSRPTVDKLGRTIIVDGQIRELTDTNTLTLTTVTETTLIAAVAAVTNDIRELVFANTSVTAVRLDLRDSTAGTVRLSVILEPGKTLFLEFTRLKQTAVNTSWTVQLSAAVTDVRITAISERVS